MADSTGALLDKANALGQAASQQTGVAFTPYTPKAITPESLQPVAPVSVPPASTPTTTLAGAGISGTATGVDAATQTLIKQQQDAADKAAANVSTDKANYDALTSELAGKGTATIAAETAAGIPDLTKSLQDATNEYNTKALDFKHQEEAILGQAGITTDQANENLSSVSRLHNSELADIAIRQSVAQGNLTAATNLVDHKIDLQYGDLKDLIGYQQHILDTDQGTLSDADKNKLSIQLDANKTALTYQTDQAKAVEDLKVKTLQAMQANGASTEQMKDVQAQTTQDGVIATAGRYGVSVADEVSLANAAKIRADALQSGQTGVTSDSVTGDTEDVLEGRNTLLNIRQTMGRSNAAAAYMQNLRSRIRQIDPNFDFVASDAGGKSVSTAYVQKATAAINSVLPNIQKVVDLSNQVSRIGVTGVDKLLQSGATTINNEKVSNFQEAQKLISDEIGVALGAGTVSDMKLQLAFDVTDPSVSQELFASNMKIVQQFIQNRLSGLQSLRYASNVTGGNYAGGNNASSTSPTNLTSQFDNLFSQYGGQ